MIKSEQKDSNILLFKKYNFQNEQIVLVFNSQFTNREIDIISCVLHGKSAKIIGVYLDISQRTVEVHMNNIMKKFDFHSKQQVLQYIETKKCLHLFQSHYISLIEKYNFRQKIKALQLVLSKNNLQARLCLGYNDDLGKSIEEDLSFINISVQTIFENNRVYPILTFIGEGKEYSVEVNRADFTKTYQLSFLNLFLNFISKKEIEDINNKYKIEYETNDQPNLFQIKYFKPTQKKYYFAFPIFLLICISVYIIYSHKNHYYYSNINYLLHPADECIERKFLYKKISDIFKSGKFVVLTGIGGAGKTTLAKMYALLLKSKFNYVVNCESKNNIQNSFREIGFVLSKTKEEIEEFSQILNIIQEKERELKVTEYIQNKLQYVSSWVLIFDNVNNFNDFSDCFQCNPKYWKNGKIIFTSQNANISCDFITNYMEVLEVPALTAEECSNLFTRIIFSHEESRKIIGNCLPSILESIAPFPLDISLVAYYIKNSHSKIIDENLIKEITEHIQVEKPEIQGSLLKKRHSIMRHGLGKIIESNQNYKAMLYVCSFLNTNNVPYDFMNLLYNRIEINDFIRKMNEYSFIENEKTNETKTHQPIYFHNIVTKYIQEYSEHELHPRDKTRIESDFVNALFLYMITKINEKDRETVVRLIPNLEDFVKNKNLDELHLTRIKFLLALSYKLNYSYEKAKILFIDNIKKLNSVHHKDMDFYAQNLAYLGMIYRNLGGFSAADKQFTQFIQIQKDNGIRNHFTFKIELEKAKLYRNIGLYEQAIDSNEKSLKGFKEHFPTDYINIISALNSSGAVFRITGEYQKAFDYLTEALNLSESKINHTKSVYPSILIQLGNLYWISGNYAMARDTHEKCVNILKSKFTTCHRDLAYALTSLAVDYTKLKEYERAEKCIFESQRIFEKNFSVDYRENVWNLCYLATIKIKMNLLSEAKEILLKAESIFDKGFPQNYIDRVWQISHLAFIEACTNNKQQAVLHLQRADKIFTQGFSKKHFFYAWFLMKKAEILSRIDKLEEATSCASESFELCQQIFGKESIKTKEYFSKAQKIYKKFYKDQ